MGIFDRVKGAFGSGAPHTPARTVTLVRDATGAPAVDLAKVRAAGHINLAKSADVAGFALTQKNLAGIRAQTLCYVDHSGSMNRDYQQGHVQALVDRALGFTLQVDADGEVPVTAWDSVVHSPVYVTQANFMGVVNRDIWRPARMGGTNLAGLLDVIKRAAASTDMPLFVIIVTDGNPDDAENKRRAISAICELSRYPAFIKILAVRPVEFLNELDDLDASMRLVDNVDTKPNDRSVDLLSCTDEQFYDAMVDEWDTWIDAAQQVGLLR